MTEGRKFVFRRMSGVWEYEVDSRNGYVFGGLVWEEGTVARRSVSERRKSSDVMVEAILRYGYTVLKPLTGPEVMKKVVDWLDSI